MRVKDLNVSRKCCVTDQAGTIGLPAMVIIGVVIATGLALAIVLRLSETNSADQPDRRSAARPGQSAQNAQLQPGRREFIENLIRNGYFERVEVSGEYPEVWVNPEFRLLDLDQQEAYLSVIYEYYAIAEGQSSSVSLHDALTGDELGRYDPTTGGLRLD